MYLIEILVFLYFFEKKYKNFIFKLAKKIIFFNSFIFLFIFLLKKYKSK